MKKRIKKLVLYGTTSIMIISTGINIKISKEKSKEFTKKVIEYTNDFDSDNFLIAAHRGYSSLAIENTLNAITLAEKAPYVDYIEIDTRLTKDNKLILAHNNTLLTNNKQKMKISNENYNTINNEKFFHLTNKLTVELENIFNDKNGDILITRTKNLEVNNYEICSLKKGLEACNEKKILLDLKFTNNTENFILVLEKELENINTNNIIFQSDDLLSLLCLQEKHPEYNILAIIKTKKDLEYISLFNNIGIKKNLVDKKLINELISKNKNIAVWTLNNPNEINNTIDKAGKHYKDIIYISDYPDVVATCLHEKEKKLEKK